MKQTLVHYLIIFAVAGSVLLGNLGASRLWDRDEPRNAGCAAEMLQRGDWVVPVFNGQLRSHKPVLLYWLVMGSYAVFGVSEFAARLPSALFGIGTALLAYHLGRRLFCRQAGLWAAVVLVTTLMFDVASRAVTPDATLIFFTTLALWFYVAGAFPVGGARSADGSGSIAELPGAPVFGLSWRFAVPMYAAMGLAVLAKGPVGVVLPCAVIGMFLLIVRLPGREPACGGSSAVSLGDRPPQGRGLFARIGPMIQRGRHWILVLLRPFAPGHFVRTFWSMRPITAVLVVLAVAGPWYVWVGLRTEGEFLREFLLTHNVGRALAPMENHHGSALLYYPAALLIGSFPWSVFAVPVLLEVIGRLRRADRWKHGLVFACCWVGVYLGVFSIAQTKLPSYVTPTYPALALLIGVFVYHWRQGNLLVSARWIVAAMVAGILVGAALAIALPLVAARYVPGEQWAGLLGAVVVAGAVGGWLLHRKGRSRQAATVFAVTAWAVCMGAFVVLPPRVSRHRAMATLLGELARQSPTVQVASFGVHEPSWVFYSRQQVKEFAPAQVDALARFVAQHAHVCVITTKSLYQRAGRQLPGELAPVATVPYFLRDEQLVVLTRKDRAQHWVGLAQRREADRGRTPASSLR